MTVNPRPGGFRFSFRVASGLAALAAGGYKQEPARLGDEPVNKETDEE
jgi:hypothetical protein